jgi:hypothetical protein
MFGRVLLTGGECVILTARGAWASRGLGFYGKIKRRFDGAVIRITGRYSFKLLQRFVTSKSYFDAWGRCALDFIGAVKTRIMQKPDCNVNVLRFELVNGHACPLAP